MRTYRDIGGGENAKRCPGAEIPIPSRQRYFRVLTAEQVFSHKSSSPAAAVFSRKNLHRLNTYLLLPAGIGISAPKHLKTRKDMKQTVVVNIRRESCDVYIGRAGRGHDGYFGNPFPLQPGMARGATLERYRTYFYDRLRSDPEFRSRIHALQGKRLGCFCKPYPCHGDIIKESLDSLCPTTK